MSSNVAPLNELPSAVLSEAQYTTLNETVRHFSDGQLLWASGYLAGRATTVAPVAALEPASDADSPSLTILYGSQTGHGQALAERLHQEGAQRGLACELHNMADYKARDIAKARWLVLIVSTHGEGDAPDDAELLLEFLSGKRAPSLGDVCYKILALGDSSYLNFCQTGRDFDARLAALGAERIGDRVECDVAYEDQAATFIEQTLETFADALEQPSQPAASVAPALKVVTQTPYSARQPYVAEVLLNQRITGRHSSKTVHHVEFAIEDSGVTYAPGDSLGVITNNPPALVDALIGRLEATRSTVVQVGDDSVSLFDALSTLLEITQLSRGFLEKYAALATADALTAQVEDTSSLKILLDDYQVIDVLTQWPASIDTQSFVDLLRPLTPRVYSIASSPLAHPDEVHITVAEVAYQKFGHDHVGSASNALVNRISDGGKIGVFVQPNPRFRLPADDVDIIMVGPGTGVAPFRAFVAEREARGASGRNWLFFGDRQFDEDFLYQSEWQTHLKRGALTRIDLAFSRDQQQKIYVQDQMTAQGAELYDWLSNGAVLYICGDASQMAPDVLLALQTIVQTHGKLSDADADAYLKSLKQQKRLLRDVY